MHTLHSLGRLTRRHFLRLAALSWLFILPLLSVLSLPAAHADALSLDPNMTKTWSRTDQQVQDGSVKRSWLWGPKAFVITTEDYDGSPGGQRLVAYYDKSRMEINNPGGDRNSKYFVTNGLLVKELISGRRAYGDTRVVNYLPADIPVAGDPGGNGKTPTYASLYNVASLDLGQNSAPSKIGQNVTAYLERKTGPGDDFSYSRYNATVAYYDNTFGHNVPKVFWDFMNSQGPVLESGKVVNGPVVDWLFSTGYALTEPYWTRTEVGGVEKDVMIQCFERRCLSYTPSNPAGFQVEMGNVGQHYYQWRYQSPTVYCSNPPVRGFGKVWSDNPSVKDRIGCPNGYPDGEIATTVITQNFEHGKMYVVTRPDNVYVPRLNTTRTVFVVFDDDKSWAAVEDKWTKGQPDGCGATAPSGLYAPVRDIASVWCNQTGLRVRERLGWAIQPEQTANGAAQSFYGGIMLYLGTSKDIFVGYSYYDRTNVWEIYKDTFVG